MSDDNVNEEVKAPELDVEQPETGATEQPAMPNGVLVLREFGEGGRIETGFVPMGDVKTTEIQTILGVALNELRRELGL